MLSLAAVVAVGLVARYGTQAFFRDGLPAAQLALTSDEDLVSRLEQGIDEGPGGRMFIRMRGSYPMEYQRFLDGMVPFIRQNSSDEQRRQAVFSYAQSYMRAFVSRHRAEMMRADPSAMAAWATSQLRTLEALAQVDPQACAEITEHASVNASTGLRAYHSVIPELESGLNATFDLIESGRTSQQAYAPLSDQEWAHLGDGALQNGTDEQALAAVGTSAFAELDPNAKCSLGIAIYRVITQEPDSLLRARMSAELLRG